LTDASRSLGAGWGRTLTRALIPNLRTAIVSSAFLTFAVVLGEFTIASVLLKRTLPQFTESYQTREPQGGMAVALLMILATTALFAVLSVVTRKRGMARAATIY
jgi:putative spermidine/putrescine transport system permease protein